MKDNKLTDVIHNEWIRVLQSPVAMQKLKAFGRLEWLPQIEIAPLIDLNIDLPVTEPAYTGILVYEIQHNDTGEHRVVCEGRIVWFGKLKDA